MVGLTYTDDGHFFNAVGEARWLIFGIFLCHDAIKGDV
jgi:hypothetical protein